MIKFRKYDPLFSVELKHPFYESGISNDFRLQPTEACKELLRNQSLLFRTTEGKATVICEKIGIDLDRKPLRPISKPLKFSFYLILNNPYFQNFTDLYTANATEADKNRRGIYFLSNIKLDDGTIIDQDEISEGMVSLSQEGAVSELDLIEPKNQRFSVRVNPDEDDIFKLERLEQKVGYIEEVNIAIEGKNTSLNIDVAASPPGIYKSILEGNDSMEKLNYLDSKLAGIGAFGVVEIYVDPFIDYNNPIKYLIEFKERVFDWRFIIVDENAEDHNTLSISFFEKTESGDIPIDLSEDVPIYEDEKELKDRIENTSNQQAIYFKKTELEKMRKEKGAEAFFLNITGDEDFDKTILIQTPPLSIVQPRLFINLK